MAHEPAVRAVDFESRKVYHSSQTPGYTSWVSFFPGERGQWYLTCEEVTTPAKPLPRCTREQFYAMSLPATYDKSQCLVEMVILESNDDMRTWEVIAREPCRFHHSPGSFGQARTKEGLFLRFVWSCYALDPRVAPNEIFYTSDDNGKTWRKMPAFHHERFASFPHRLRMLRDGTFVLAMPLRARWGKGTDYPVRASLNLNAINEMQMTLWFSFDQGRTWDGPLPIFGGQNISETDFVELPSGDLLFIDSFFATPGRQFVYREGRRFTPGPMERAIAGQVPETICLTEEGVLVGCFRPSGVMGGEYHPARYTWSDDLGLTWWPLEGIPAERPPECYQPWIHYLGDGRIACAGHYGSDIPVGMLDQYLSIHFIKLEVLRKTKDTCIEVEREFDESVTRWPNAYTITLTCDGEPLADKELEFWHVEVDKPGYDSYNKTPLQERMKMGGQLIRVRTGADGVAHVTLPHLDEIQDTHYSYQFIVRFNADRADPKYKPAQTPQFEFYAAWWHGSPPE